MSGNRTEEEANPPLDNRSRAGRRVRWWPQVTCAEDEIEVASLIKEFGSSDGTRERIRKQFNQFCEINNLAPADGIRLWIGQMRRMGLMWSTIDVYLSYVRSMVGRTTAFIFYKKLTALAHADQCQKSIPMQDTRAIRRMMLATKNPALSALIFIMASTGCRCRDASRLRRSQIEITNDGNLHVEFRITKTRRKRALRFHLTVPLRWFGIPSRVARSYLANGNPSQKLFGAYNTASCYNTEVKEICLRLNMPVATSKSLRRYFINELLDLFDGNLETVRRYTGHLDTSTVDAFYRYWQKEQ